MSSSLASELRVAIMRTRRRLVSERDPHNELSIGQMTVLGLLHRHGESTVGTLADLERVKPPSMTRTVNCLVESGHVTRRASEDDKRQVLVELSDSGQEALMADRRSRDKWLRRRLDELSKDERDVLRHAVTILERLSSTP